MDVQRTGLLPSLKQINPKTKELGYCLEVILNLNLLVWFIQSIIN